MRPQVAFAVTLMSLGSIADAQRGDRPALSGPGTISFGSSSAAQAGNPSIRRIHWRGTDQAVELKLTPFDISSKEPVYVSVWALGLPSTAMNGRPVPADRVGRIAFIERIEPATRELTLKIDFSSFAPPIPGKKKSPYSGFIIQSAPSGLASISKAMATMVREATMARLSRDGTTTYSIIATQGKATSNALTVEYGELMASDQSAESLAQTQYGTPEFPEEKFGPSGTFLTSRNFMGLRYRIPQGTKKALFQVCQTWEHPGYALWTTVKPALQVDLPLNQKDSKDSSFLRTSIPTTKFAADADQTRYWGRVVPLDANGNLAGKPSNPIALVVSNPPSPAKVDVKPKLSFTYELVGWRPGYEANPTDQYRFIVANAYIAPLSKLEKVTGKKVGQGSKVYLPPSPPPEEKAWYEKVVDAIAEAISAISDFVTLVSTTFVGFVGAIKQLPFFIAEELGLPKSASASVKNAIDAPFKVSNAVLNAPARIASAPGYVAVRMLDDMGVTDPNKRAALQGNFRGAITGWAKKKVWENSEMSPSGLAPDPDFEQRTGVAYVRVTANVNPALPSGYRESFYPISVSVTSIARDASSLGIPAQPYTLYEGTGLPCTLAPGQSILVPIVMDYHWTYDSRKEDWMFGWKRMESTRFTVNGKSITNQNLHKQWGTVSE